MPRFSWRAMLLVLVLLGLAWSPGQAGETPSTDRRLVTDMCGRQVSVPAHITRIVTAEGTPSVNSTLFALGKGDLIVNGLPSTMRGSHWKYQLLFAPQLADLPAVSAHGVSWVPNLEVLQSIPHDVAMVVTPAMAQLLTERGFTAVCLGWGNPVTMLGSIRFLGDILECPAQSQAFLDYYQSVIDRVAKRMSSIPITSCLRNSPFRTYSGGTGRESSRSPAGITMPTLVISCSFAFSMEIGWLPVGIVRISPRKAAPARISPD